jgi:Na+/H+-dicarboxylate symporter
VAELLPYPWHQAFYTISLLLKDLLLLIMPLTVCFFIGNTVATFEKKAPLFILTLVLFETFSNFSGVWYANFAAQATAEHLPALAQSTIDTTFAPLWRLHDFKPIWWSADKGAMAGLLLGSIAAFQPITRLPALLANGKKITEWILIRVFARFIPLFILGFAANMFQTNILGQVVTHYGMVVLWLTLFLAGYLIFLFALSAGGSPAKILRHIANLLPAGGLALTSGCSLSTMPWTIEGTRKNMKNPELATAIIPATTNIQQIGDCIANAFLCFLIYRHFYGINPDAATWLHFSVLFVIARFATAAVLGGAIFVMLPIYESALNFTPEMIAIILALNVVLDPIITSSNVMANGALCRVFERVWNALPFLRGIRQTSINP